VQEDRRRLELGKAFISEVSPDLHVATIVGQHGYGRSARPRIRYAAVREALTIVARFAKANASSVHMPRIGAGQAGGRWPVLSEVVEDTLTRQGVPVTVYVPPGQPIRVDSVPSDELTLDV
jgi:O-acetyl-ADP-ribose deacetylase (regulator of RNase III)